MGRMAPHLAEAINKVFEDKQMVESKASYVSAFRHYFRFCLDFEIDPLKMPLDPEVCIYWIQQRIEMKGSIASLSTWTAMLHWISELAMAPMIYKSHPLYTSYLAAIRKKYEKGVDHRLPFRLHHIHKYTLKTWKSDKGENTISFDNLLRILIANLYFFTMSRPCEILRASGSSLRKFGLLIGDIQKMVDLEHSATIYEFKVRTKNAASRKIFKKIYISSSRCNKHHQCICAKMDPFMLLDYYMKRRRDLCAEIHQTLGTGNLSESEYATQTTRLENLAIKKSKPLLVWSDGKTATTKDLAKIAKEISRKAGIVDPQHYTSYSLRIGGTTAASMAKIDHVLILKYVGWSVSRLADCGQRYMRYSPYELSMMPFKIIHGEYDSYSRNQNKIYDPWSEKINMKYFKM